MYLKYIVSLFDFHINSQEQQDNIHGIAMQQSWQNCISGYFIKKWNKISPINPN